MGYREWRARQNERIDAMTARADERARQAKRREAGGKAEREQARANRQQDALSAWYHEQAARIREDHDDLVRRAEAVGVPLPRPRGSWNGFSAGVGTLLAGGPGADSIDSRSPYREWRDRIVVEERCAAKLARGESLSRLDRMSLKSARFVSKF